MDGLLFVLILEVSLLQIRILGEYDRLQLFPHNILITSDSLELLLIKNICYRNLW